MNSLNINPTRALDSQAAPHQSKRYEKQGPPSFSRSASAPDPFGIQEKLFGHLKISTRFYDEDLYENDPALSDIGNAGNHASGQVDVKRALQADLKRLDNDFLHGRIDKACERIQGMSTVDIGDLLTELHVDRDLIAKFGEIAHNRQLTPLEAYKAACLLMRTTGAYDALTKTAFIRPESKS